jgi:UPF0042 nucleotide-binding protein
VSLSIIILTGLSGAGKTVALRALEDCGYFCTDNLPPQLINDFIDITSSKDIRMIAIGIDIREKGFLSEIGGIIANLKKRQHIEIVFLESERDVIVRRFKETRRPHPLGKQHGFDIEKSFENEITILAPLRDLADRVIDTSPFTPHQLRDMIKSIYGGPEADRLNVILTSFGFKFGVPQSADLVFDVRFLPNPHFVPELKDLTGMDNKVLDYVKKDGTSDIFIDKVKEVMDFLIPLYIKEGKSSLNICIGCTGGRHRSVAIIEELKAHFDHYPIHLETVHREL